MAIIADSTIKDENGVQQTAHPRTETEAITDATTLAKAIMRSSDAKTILTKLGATSYAQTLLTKATAGDFLSALGVSAFVKSALAGADAGDVLNDILPKTAQAHNNFYRGKDLTAYYNNGGFSKAVAAGTFDDIFLGDYITKEITVDGTSIGQERYLIADLDYELYAGDSMLTTTHHAAVVPQDVLNVNVRMCATNDTTGGYVASEMWQTTIPKYVTAIQNAFGSGHVLKHRELLSNAISASAPAGGGAGWVGSSSGWAWYDVYVNLMNENMVYGGRVWGSAYDTCERTSQLALFRHNQSARIAGYRGNRTVRKWYWLTAVASASQFAYGGGSSDYGLAYCCEASYQGVWGGIRPFFLLY